MCRHVRVSYATNVDRITVRYMPIRSCWIQTGTTPGGTGMALIEEEIEEWYRTGHEWTSLYRLSCAFQPIYHDSSYDSQQQFGMYMSVETPRKSLDVLILLPSYDLEDL